MAFFLPNLQQRGYLDRLQMTLCHVGSRKLSAEDDYGSQQWQIFAPNLMILGFDADPAACDAANAEFECRSANWHEFHLPIALAKETGPATLYVTKNPMCSSLYPPNEALLSHFPALPALVNLAYTTQIETTTLDQFCQQEELSAIDFLQIDVQGAELQVLEGASQILQTVFAVQVEVEFAPLYQNQPLFAEVDTFLRQQGFALFDLSQARRSRSLIHSARRPGQLLWGDAIYLRDPFDASTPAQFQTPSQRFKLACIADALEWPDFALQLLESLTLSSDRDSEYNFADLIIEQLSQMPELVEQGLQNLAIVKQLAPYLAQQQIS